jgi:hypothetical protein
MTRTTNHVGVLFVCLLFAFCTASASWPLFAHPNNNTFTDCDVEHIACEAVRAAASYFFLLRGGRGLASPEHNIRLNVASTLVLCCRAPTLTCATTFFCFRFFFFFFLRAPAGAITTAPQSMNPPPAPPFSLPPLLDTRVTPPPAAPLRPPISAYVMLLHASAYDSIDIRQHTSAYVGICTRVTPPAAAAASCFCIRPHTSAYVTRC